MLSREGLDAFIDRLGDGEVESKEVAEGLWVISSGAGEIVVNYAPPVAVLRVNIVDLPEDQGEQVAIMRKLLELNATDLVHGSYGVEGTHVVLTDTLELENLDYNEFQASVDSILLALASHVPSLVKQGEA